MDISDIEVTRDDVNATNAGESPQAQTWHELVGALGAEIALPLTAALERINALAATGTIDRKGLRALREEVEAARGVSMAGQQLARLASGRLRQAHERIDLAQMLAGVLAHRAREIDARGVNVESRSVPKPVEVVVDAPLVFSLLNAVLDWALACTRSKVKLCVDVTCWPVRARLACSFAHRPPDQLDDGVPTPAEASRLDSMHWRLLEHTARALGVALDRRIGAGGTTLALEFPRTVNETMEGLSIVELDDGVASSPVSRPFAGNHVLVVASQRELHSEVRHVLRGMGLLIDGVDSISQAAGYCRDGLPHAIVIDSRLCDESFTALRSGIVADVPGFAFIAIDDDDSGHAHREVAVSGTSRVDRATLAHALAPALLLELSRQE